MTATVPTESKSPSRRALLAGALGGLGAWAASAIGRANPVRAEGQAIVVGGEYSTAESVTSIHNQPAVPVDTIFAADHFGEGVGIRGTSGGGIGVRGASVTDIGVFGTSDSYTGVYGRSESFRGVNGFSPSGQGVRGVSSSGQGVWGQSTTNTGVYGDSFDYVGVYGDSENHNGVVGNNRSLNHAAVIGYSEVDGTGVEGVSGGGVAIPGKPKTGVYGEAAQDTNAKGVWGHSPAGRGIQGSTTTGYAGYFAGKVFSTKFYELAEIASAPAPAGNRARLFIRDNAGKTQLCVRFSTGAVQVLATQP